MPERHISQFQNKSVKRELKINKSSPLNIEYCIFGIEIARQSYYYNIKSKKVP